MLLSRILHIYSDSISYVFGGAGTGSGIDGNVIALIGVELAVATAVNDGSLATS
jgi:hypothetical protein